jgi:hypothetical protein
MQSRKVKYGMPYDFVALLILSFQPFSRASIARAI